MDRYFLPPKSNFHLKIWDYPECPLQSNDSQVPSPAPPLPLNSTIWQNGPLCFLFDKSSQTRAVKNCQNFSCFLGLVNYLTELKPARQYWLCFSRQRVMVDNLLHPNFIPKLFSPFTPTWILSSIADCFNFRPTGGLELRLFRGPFPMAVLLRESFPARDCFHRGSPCYL